jgi:hypothetical protein
MIPSLEAIREELSNLISFWEQKLTVLPEKTITSRKNSQNRNIRQIIGHMVDSATNNIHRIVHMHYQESPVNYPDYANKGNNDRWISIQNYQEEDWGELVQLWISLNRHMVHLIGQVDESKLNQEWINALNEKITLRTLLSEYQKHFKLHLNEISALINQLTIEHD